MCDRRVKSEKIFELKVQKGCHQRYDGWNEKEQRVVVGKILKGGENAALMNEKKKRGHRILEEGLWTAK